jgi:NO-binding membrane sensor protein with MHYT domain
VGAAVDHYDEYHLYTVVFSLLAAVQFGWAALIVRRATPRLLMFGCVFNLGVIALWVVSRTAGVPLAPEAWVPEEIGVADLVETIGELVTAIGAFCLALAPRYRLARIVGERMAVPLLIVLLLATLYGVGAHAG